MGANEKGAPMRKGRQLPLTPSLISVIGEPVGRQKPPKGSYIQFSENANHEG